MDAGRVRGSARLSPCGLFRHELRRWWAPGPRLTFVMLNPSSADATHDDPTLRRCAGFARALGFGGLRVVNLYAYRATDPAELWRAARDGVDVTGGAANDEVLGRVGSTARRQLVVAAWGAHARADRVAEVTALPGWHRVHALGTTRDGAPRHPLYLPASARPEPWRPRPAPRPA